MDAAVSVERFLEEVKIPLRLAVVTEAGWPLVLSLWYLYEDGVFWCATPRRAQVVGYLAEEARCGYEVAGDEPPYCGVRGRALATIDEAQGTAVLRRLLQRYLGGLDNDLARGLLARPEPEVAIRLVPQSRTAWNFSARMAGSLARPAAKLCPEAG